MILCDAEVPSYDAMNYEPEQLIITRETPPPPVEPPPAPPEFETDEIPETKKEVPCPGPGQLRVGDVTQSGDERVIGHRLLEDGKTCETLYEPTTTLEKYLPPVNQAATVTALAVVATAGAAVVAGKVAKKVAVADNNSAWVFRDILKNSFASSKLDLNLKDSINYY